ncbi:MAG TPA: MMPL family transporter [Solirubrobacteraceae bacterium]|jgi:RND superfamily putative drug exporter|nr:MMPL family transporter [Solirubrobacteraceae bacterium]
MRRLARWCVDHRRIVVAGWVIALIALTAIKSSIGSDYRDSFNLSGTPSFDAQNLLQASAPSAAGDSEQIVFAAKQGTVRSPAVRATIDPMLARMARFPDVASVGSPYAPAGAGQISKDGKVAFAKLNLTKDSVHILVPEAKRIVAAAQSGAGPAVEVEVAGQVAEQANPMAEDGTGIGALAALVILFVVFGSALAAAMPLVTTGIALGVGSAVVGLLSHLINMASFSSELSLLIGLGVGVDYALFIVTRARQGIQRGRSVPDAIVDSLDTSGRAVMFAGITVCIALLGMFALGVSFLYGVAIAASITVAFTVLAALTLLPALLGFVKLKVLPRRQRKAHAGGALQAPDPRGFWFRWSGAINRRPVVFATVAGLLILAIAVPFLSMRLGSSDAGSDPGSTTTRKAYDLLAKGFGPGYNGPLLLVAKVDGPAQKAGFEAVLAAVAKAPDVVTASPAAYIPSKVGGGSVALASVYPKGSPQDVSTTTLLNQLRDHTVPDATGASGVNVLIGGQTAIFEDFSNVLGSKLPLFIGVVVLLSFLLLTAVFRSIVIPAMAAVMNLLSAAAAFGVITAVFQDGFAAGVFGIDKTGPIEAFVPVLMFAILFGLSMDYEVFLVTRIYEEWHRSGDNRLAITRGLAATGRTITAAALIMILVFGAFILGGERIIELFGLGLASAVALDALIVRSTLVPALMTLTGDWNWKLPRFLDRILPRLNVEGSVVYADDAPGLPVDDFEPEPSPA